MTTMTPGRELALLRELGVIAIDVRRLRATEPRLHMTLVKALEAQTRLKWDEIRALRAAPANGASDLPAEGYHATDRPAARRPAR